MAANSSAAASVVRKLGPPPFGLGKKQVFLPNHVVTLLRTDHQPAHWATFRVPLTFTKFDMRDYLLHAYQVPVTAVRSQVRYTGVRSDAGHRIRRLVFHKYMTVEMGVKATGERLPFVWPAVPTDLTPWSKSLWEARVTAEKRQQAEMVRRGSRLPLPSLEGDDRRRDHYSAEDQSVKNYNGARDDRLSVAAMARELLRKRAERETAATAQRSQALVAAKANAGAKAAAKAEAKAEAKPTEPASQS